MTEVSIAQAAASLGVSVDTVRRRLRRGELRSRTDATGHLLVALEGAPALPPQAGTGELAQLRAELDALRELLAEVRRQRDDLVDQLHDAARERAELRRLLGSAQLTLETLLQAPLGARQRAPQG